MSNQWENLAKQASSQRESSAADAEKKKNADFEETKIPAENLPWNYELKRIMQLLGWKVARKESEVVGSVVVGEEYVRTSENTFERRQKRSGGVLRTYYKMRLDKTRIRDQKKYDDLVRDVTEFYTQSKEKIGENVAPVLFNNKEIIPYLCPDLKLWIVLLVVGAMTLMMRIMGFLMSASVFALIYGFFFWFAHSHRKKCAAYKPLIDEYFKKIEEYEVRAKSIIRKESMQKKYALRSYIGAGVGVFFALSTISCIQSGDYNVLPFIIIIALAGAAAFIYFRKKRLEAKAEEEEDEKV